MPAQENEAAVTRSSPEPDRRKVTLEARSLLEQENITAAIRNYIAETDEQKIAVEFINGYFHFMTETVENDRQAGLLRTDIEIRDYTSHINMLLRQRDESLFILMVKMNPAHYKAINKSRASAEKKD